MQSHHRKHMTARSGGVQGLCPSHSRCWPCSQNLFRAFGRALNGSRCVIFILRAGWVWEVPLFQFFWGKAGVGPCPQEFHGRSWDALTASGQLSSSAGWCCPRGILFLLCPKGVYFLCSEGILLLQTLPCCLFLLWGQVTSGVVAGVARDDLWGPFNPRSVFLWWGCCRGWGVLLTGRS